MLGLNNLFTQTQGKLIPLSLASLSLMVISLDSWHKAQAGQQHQ